jgi:glycine betaine transporter
MFVFLQQFPLALPMSILTLVVLWIFFVAGADAGTIVLGSMSTGGPQEPVRWIKLAWGLAMAAIAGILLVAGGLGALQSASVLTGLPFAFIMVAICVALFKHLSDEAGGGGTQGREDVDVAERVRESPAIRRTPGRPAPGQAFTAEDPALRDTRHPNPGEPETGGR